MGRDTAREAIRHMTNRDRPTGPAFDPRFQLHHRQPRANKLDARQRTLCRADATFAEALRRRVSNPDRFSAFIAGAASYIVLDSPCLKCGSLKKRTRDRSCHGCHLARSGANFQRIKAGVSPIVSRTLASHLDLLERAKSERQGEHVEAVFDGLTARYWPSGRLEVLFPDGHHEHDLSKLPTREIDNAVSEYPALRLAIKWAGWTEWPD